MVLCGCGPLGISSPFNMRHAPSTEVKIFWGDRGRKEREFFFTYTLESHSRTRIPLKSGVTGIAPAPLKNTISVGVM